MNLQELNELDFNDIGVWPQPVKIAMIIITFVLIAVGGYVYLIADSISALDVSRSKEAELKIQFETKAGFASNLEAYKQQMVELEGLLQAQLRQLPNKNEVAGLSWDLTAARIFSIKSSGSSSATSSRKPDAPRFSQVSMTPPLPQINST